MSQSNSAPATIIAAGVCGIIGALFLLISIAIGRTPEAVQTKQRIEAQISERTLQAACEAADEAERKADPRCAKFFEKK